MTAEKMTLAEALDVALDEAFPSHDFYERRGDLKQAAAVLREFRERGLPFYCASRQFAASWAPIPLEIQQRHLSEHGVAMVEQYRRLTTEGE